MTRATVTVQRASSHAPCDRCCDLPTSKPHGADFEVSWRQGAIGKVSVRVCAATLPELLAATLVVEREAESACRHCGAELAKRETYAISMAPSGGVFCVGCVGEDRADA